MAERTEKWNEMEVTARYEQFENDLSNADSVEELQATLESLTEPAITLEDRINLYKYAGPARVVAQTLRGYEIPDVAARHVSNNALLSVDAALRESSDAEALLEQIWLILAAQQDILLERIEADLEALHNADQLNESALEQQKTLAKTHLMLRTRSKDVVAKLFQPIQSELPFSLGV